MTALSVFGLKALPRTGELLPHSGLELPRSWLRTNAPSLSLDGTWDFTYYPAGIAAYQDTWPDAALVTGAGGEQGSIEVPGH